MKKLIVFIIILIGVSCSKADKKNSVASLGREKGCAGSYEVGFNAVRDSIGLESFGAKWQLHYSETGNVIWCNDSIDMAFLNDSVSFIGQAFYIGKALVFEDSDSLFCDIKFEIDIFVYKKYRNRETIYIEYNFDDGIDDRWRYSLEREIERVENDNSFFPSFWF